MEIIITAPSLDVKINVSGLSAMTNFIIENNSIHNYSHFKLGKSDDEKRGFFWFFRILKAWFSWVFTMVSKRDFFVHFNFALDMRSIIRDAPLILFARLLQKRMIIHMHGGSYLEKDNVPILIKYILIVTLSGHAPKVVLSSYEKGLVMKNYRAKNVVVLPNCIDLYEAKEFNRSYPFKPPIKLLFLGRIVKSKGIEFIIDALKSMKEKNIRFKFIMAGNSPDKIDFIHEFSTILGADFEFKGVVYGKEKTDLLKQCNIFLLPSLIEGLPIALLECMSFGLVPITTNVGSIKHLIKNGINGIIIKTSSSEEIVNAVQNLLSDKEYLEGLSKNARQFIFSNFNPEEYIEKLNEIYSYA